MFGFLVHLLTDFYVSILLLSLSSNYRYAMETVYFDEHVRTAKQQQLESKALQVRQYYNLFSL